MALSAVTFDRTDGNIPRTLPGTDHISGAVFYGAKPAGFGSANTVPVFSLKEAETAGITAAAYPVQHYHISEFFRLNPGGKLWVGIYAAPAVGVAHDFAELVTMQNDAGDEVKQAFVYTQLAFASAQVTALQAKADQLQNEGRPLSVIFTADISAQTLTGLPDLLTANAKNVSAVIGQDGGGTGSQLYTSQAKTIGAGGAVLGAVSRAAVHESAAWPAKFNFGGAELDSLAFGEGTLYKTVTVTQLADLDAKGYLFLMKERNVLGSFLNGTWTASAGDYNTIELNRAIDKAVRGIDSAMAYLRNSPVYVNSAGELRADQIAAIRNRANAPLKKMETAGELSGYSVEIDPKQNVVANSTLNLVIQNIPVGVARYINIKIGYTTATN